MCLCVAVPVFLCVRVRAAYLCVGQCLPVAARAQQQRWHCPARGPAPQLSKLSAPPPSPAALTQARASPRS
eukprot:15439085-Alexandrium_andersonii.AAC.1